MAEREQTAAVSGILLAAGRSTRFGKQKLLLPVKKRPMILQALEPLLRADLAEVVVVLGPGSGKVAEILADRPVTVAVNPRPDRGLSSSIAQGLRTVSPSSDAVLLHLGDIPFVGPHVVHRILREYAESDAGIVAPVFRGKRGHPVLFRRQYFPELESLKGDVGGREIIRRHSGNLVEVPAHCAGILIDIDTEADYRKVRCLCQSK